MIALAKRLYRAGLRLMPGRLRRKHGRAMHAAFSRRIDEAASDGPLAVLAVTGRGLLDLLARSAYERLRTPGRSGPGDPLVHRVMNDFRFALRTLWRAPRFTAAALLVLALGMGANVALFSVVHGVVLRPLPFPQPDRVVHLAWDRGSIHGWMPAWKYAYWREHSTAFEGLATWRSGSARVGEDESPTGALLVSPDFLDVVDVEPAAGRGFAPDEHRAGGPSVVMLGHDFWMRRFGGDPAVQGGTIEIDGAPHDVVGILPASFAFPQAPDHADLVAPLRLEPDPLDEGENWPVLARLRDGVDRGTAERDLALVTERFRAEHQELINEPDRGMILSSYRDLYVGSTGTTLWILMGASVLVLLIACANVAALLLARGSNRRSEYAVRTAIGAGKGALVRQILTEGLVLALAATGLALVIGRVGVDALLGLYPGELPRSDGIGLNGWVVGYAVAAALVTAGAFGLAAALPVLRGDLSAGLREGSWGGTGGGRVRRAVLVLESAVSVVLLVGAGLLVATVAEIRSVDPGFDPENLLTAALRAPAGGWESEGGLLEAVRRTRQRVAAVPGVTSVATVSDLPLTRGLNFPVGMAGRPDDYVGDVELRSASPRYLETLGMRLRQGRGIGDGDGPDAPRVALVNRAFAERWFPDGDVLGKGIEIGRYRDRFVVPGLYEGPTRIVGVFDDIRERSLKHEGKQMVVIPEAQVPEGLARAPFLVARVSSPSVAASVRRALAESTPGGGAPEVLPMRSLVAENLAPERFNAILMVTFGVVAGLLTGFGIYGVVSYGVRQRTREIGIRLALGASRREVVRLVAGQGLGAVLVGLVLGIAGALWLSRLIASLLWGVTPADPRVLVGVPLVLAAIALAASWWPAREAAGVDPGRSLRPE